MFGFITQHESGIFIKNENKQTKITAESDAGTAQSSPKENEVS